MKQIDSVMRELYAAKRRNAQVHKNVEEYLKFLLRNQQAAVKSVKAKRSRAKTTSKARAG